MLTITVNDRPLSLAPIVRRGRVLLPMRATFTALGASVRYDPHGRIVVARCANHRIRLPIDSYTALVDGVRTPLDVRARVVASRTYVPLRFVAQSLGASVGYDARAALVTVTTAVSAPQPVSVSVLAPSPGASVASAYAEISAALDGANASSKAIAISVDGLNVTSLATFDGRVFTYLPRTPLALGLHTVSFSGNTEQGSPFSQVWSFTTTSTPPSERTGSFYSYPFDFFVNGSNWYNPGDWMHFTLIAPPGGSASLQLCGLGFEYPFWNGGNGGYYVADVPAPYGYWIPDCQVTAMYTAWNGQEYFVPEPLYVGLYTLAQRYYAPAPTQTSAPGPSSHPIALPPGKRRPPSTPLPVPSIHPSTPRPWPSFHPPVHVPIRPQPVRVRQVPVQPVRSYHVRSQPVRVRQVPVHIPHPKATP